MQQLIQQVEALTARVNQLEQSDVELRECNAALSNEDCPTGPPLCRCGTGRRVSATLADKRKYANLNATLLPDKLQIERITTP